MFPNPIFFALLPKHITVSTVGIVPRMVSMAKDLSDLNLVLSLHAPTPEKRLKIVPSAKSYAISKIMGTLDGHFARSKKTSVMVECMLIKDANDAMEIICVFSGDSLSALLTGCFGGSVAPTVIRLIR
eukprot:841738_1